MLKHPATRDEFLVQNQFKNRTKHLGSLKKTKGRPMSTLGQSKATPQPTSPCELTEEP